MQPHPPHAVYPLPQYQQYYIRRNPENLSAEKLAKQFAISVSEVLELWRREEYEERRRDYLAENGYTSDFRTYAAELASLYADEPQSPIPILVSWHLGRRFIDGLDMGRFVYRRNANRRSRDSGPFAHGPILASGRRHCS